MRFSRLLLALGFSLLLLGLAVIFGIYGYYSKDLPSIEVLRDVRLQVPLRVYTRDGELIAEFGEKRRTPVSYDDIPPIIIKAFLAAEDDRYFQHPGVDYQGITRAAIQLLMTGQKKQGGSTITMQVARNFFLTNEKTYERKIREIFLALKIERSLSKREILELYLNKIYLGNRSYGVGAASRVYYGRPLDELSIAEVAMIAGLPKAPSRYNPIVNPRRAMIRRNYVLDRMLELGFIPDEEHQIASSSGLTARLHAPVVSVRAPHIAEMVRSQMVAAFGESAYTLGLKVTTTVHMESQNHANRSLRRALDQYDMRHGYRGPESRIAESGMQTIEAMDRVLEQYSRVGELLPALVIRVNEKDAQIYLGDGKSALLGWEGIKWARPYINENRRGSAPEKATDVLAAGDLIRIRRVEVVDSGGKEPKREIWQLRQIPAVAGAFVALNPSDGAILSLVGGYDFYASKFNRATQARRQSGSGFKPVLYTAALEAGFTPATTILDAPIVFEDRSMQEGLWRPQNYSSKFFGPTRLRQALYKSRNLVSVRLLDSVGIEPVRKMAQRFGFLPEELPNSLTLSLGSGTTVPIRISGTYAVFANGGYRVQPYLIDRIHDLDGQLVLKANPWIVCKGCDGEEEIQRDPAINNELLMPLRDYLPGDVQADSPESVRTAPRIISSRVHYQIASILRDVIRQGTGRKARKLGRNDLGGKTGTTNEQRDAWFNGFNPDLVATVWVGFDKFSSLGKNETGSKAALPMWIDYMDFALRGHPQKDFLQPDGMVTLRIDPSSGKALAPGATGGIFETFRREYAPEMLVHSALPAGGKARENEPIAPAADITRDLF